MMGMQPQIILLKEGTDSSQGKPQLISNINACMAVVDTVRTTLGPRGMDKLIHDSKVRSAHANVGRLFMFESAYVSDLGIKYETYQNCVIETGCDYL